MIKKLLYTVILGLLLCLIGNLPGWALGEELMVKKGDRVAVEVVNKNILVTTFAQALESGKKGQEIRILPLSGHKVLKARIIDNGKVQVKVR